MLQPSFVDNPSPGVFVADSMRRIANSARRIAATYIPVLITGESGVGKEVLARFIHEHSLCARKPFVAFNCATVPRDLIDSQLFGYRKGAFTGAVESFPGVIRAAEGGTLFLDEVAELGRELQPKLLRFLESAEVSPLGETQPIRVKVRIVAATNAHLDQLTRDGGFRQDLLYRLSGAWFQIPPLRDRRDEIPLMATYFLQKFSKEFAKRDVTILPATIERLVRFGWPGNVRQLANEIRRAVALADDGDALAAEQLGPQLVSAASGEEGGAPATPLSREIRLRLDQPLASAMESLQRSMVNYALGEAHGKLTSAAKLLGVSRKGLYLKRHRLGLVDAADAATQENEEVSQ